MFKKGSDAERKVERFKARLVAQRFAQRYVKTMMKPSVLLFGLNRSILS